MNRILLATLILLAFGTTGAYATGSEGTVSLPPLLLIYDSSNSMWGTLPDGSRKYEAGRRAIAAALASTPPERLVALRAYGHRHAERCDDIELLLPLERAAVQSGRIEQRITALRPTGKTPITRSLTLGLDDLPQQRGEILLITDGVETCDADPCTLIERWRARGIDVRVHVVGVGLEHHQRQAMQCLTDTSGGIYRDADSEESFSAAITEISRGAPQPVPQPNAYAVVLDSVDMAGEPIRALGMVRNVDGNSSWPIRSDGRTPLPGPGRYIASVGARLANTEPYAPTEVPFTIDAPGEQRLRVAVRRPASLSATFTKAGEPHPGALVTAWSGAEQAFQFRPADRPFAAPGAYRFTTELDADNTLELSATLVEGEHTEIAFEAVSTVRVTVDLTLPDGSVRHRVVSLHQIGEQRYRFHGGHGSLVRPGTYEIRSDDPALPLQAQSIQIQQADTHLALPLDAGFVRLTYSGAEEDFTGRADRANLVALDRNASIYLGVDKPQAVLPGRYRVEPHKAAGYFQPIEIEVTAAQTTDAEIVARATGALVVHYADSGNYARPPDRAFVYAAEGQELRRSYLTPGTPVRLLPGAYRVEGWKQAGDIAPQTITIAAGQTSEVVLEPR